MTSAISRSPLGTAVQRPYVRARVYAGRRWRRYDRFTLDDRRTGAEQALIVLAGHKGYLWPWTLSRVAEFCPSGVDVCVVTPGLLLQPLRDLAEQRGWSYLGTQAGNVSVAQNLAIHMHPNAQLIYKLDEDIFISAGFFEGLLEGYRRIQEEGRFEPGFCSPVINVNGFSYVDFLEALGLEQEYELEFGELRRASDGIRAHHDGHAAAWLWRHSLPVDRTSSVFSDRAWNYSTVPHRFSIGAILFERSLWDEMGWFARVRRAPGLGVDEQHICVSCVTFSRVMVVLHNVYAGHFAFGPQEAIMREAFETDLPTF